MSKRTAYSLGVMTGALCVPAGMALVCWLKYRTVIPA